MTNDPDRKARDLELLKKSRQALHDEQNQVERRAEEPPSGDPPSTDSTVMYRGRPVRTAGTGPKVPGAGAGRPVPGANSFRGSGRGAPRGAGDTKALNNVKLALQKLSDLHQSGLITKAEYDKKRAQILDRM